MSVLEAQSLDLAQGHVGDAALAVGGAVDLGVVHQDEGAVARAAHVDLDQVDAQRHAALEGGQ